MFDVSWGGGGGGGGPVDFFLQKGAIYSGQLYWGGGGGGGSGLPESAPECD